ncbi:MAG: hypothetical protein KF799_04215 [Bdellovibrionales bacterium]|nr:hypothetical protein [Bdellovibrionales bacterium]
MSNSMYYLPKEGETRNFKAEVKMQGSGILKNGDIIDYRGRVSRTPGDCPTTVNSASGECLLPYFSIAADLRYHRAGDIIYVPEVAEMKLKVKLPPSNVEIIHPGYFVVHDTGGAIKGSDRFDFFTGTDKPLDKDNPFLNIGMADRKSCKNHFVKLERNSDKAQQAMAQIERLTPSAHIRLASDQSNDVVTVAQ